MSPSMADQTIIRPFLSADAGTGSGGDAAAGGTSQGSPPPAPGASPPPVADGGGGGVVTTDPFAVVAGQKPGGLPDKFWNPDTKAIRLPELMRSYAEAESLIGRRVEQMTQPDFQHLVETKVSDMTKELEAKALQNIRGQAPAEPKDYTLQPTAELMNALPEGMRDMAQYEQDPLVNWFRGFAHELGLGPGQFNKAFEGYLSTVASAHNASIATERSKLGENATKRMESLSNFLDANLEKRQAMALRAALTSAEAFAAVEGLIKRLADPSLIRGFSDAGEMGRSGPGLSTEQEIRMAQKDPRYWDPMRRDPGYVKAIDNAWKNLYSRGNGQL
jgi:hypothetical protein